MTRRLSAVLLVTLAALALAGCSKCDIAGWGVGPKACHSDAPLR
jgi:hypothetical protein